MFRIGPAAPSQHHSSAPVALPPRPGRWATFGLPLRPVRRLSPVTMTMRSPGFRSAASTSGVDGIITTMDQCCQIGTNVLAHQRRVLQIVLWLNVLMFIGEFGAGIAAHSTALLADSIDMFGDAVVYGFSLYAIARRAMWQARAAVIKGLIMAAFAVGVLIEVAHKLVAGALPSADVMSVVGMIALVANAFCLVLLSRRRGDDINMRSAWLCSRNDVIANTSVLLAAGGVAYTGSGWPDILVGLAIAGMFATSAMTVIQAARRQLRPLTVR
jgi:Co/Zn/Cd efflux system component